MQMFQAKAIGEQITIGKLHFYHRQPYDLTERSGRTPEEEEKRFLWAQRNAMLELAALYDRAEQEMSSEVATIFAIHAMLAEDNELTRRVLEMIRAGSTAEYAVHTVGEQVVRVFEQMDSEYMQARGADIYDIVRRMILRLVNVHPPHRIGEEPVILVCESYLPSEIMELDRRRILGLVTTGGSVDSHTAQIIRYCGIPALVGVPLTAEMEGLPALMDGNTGRLYLEPTTELMDTLRRAYEARGCPVCAGNRT